MRIARGLAEVPEALPAPVLALGTFDGIHVGHRQVIGGAMARARDLEGTAVVVTFDPHPLEVLRPGTDPVLLTTLDERLALLDDAGVDLTVVLPFDLAFAQIPAETWLDEILAGRLGACAVFAGSSYTFGHRRQGTAARLAEWGRDRGVEVHLIPAVLVSGEPVSSSRIRTALREGLVDEAARLLGRWYGLGGPVTSGQGRGRTIGFPTANLVPPARKVLPGQGVYATIVDVDGRRYGGATNVGRRPTFGGGDVTVETHLLGFAGELSGRTTVVSFVQRLREERTFPGADALVRQIHDDVEHARQLLAGVGPGIIR
ncbi:MAG TPA: bifunctional riboflavin kinase/FAD synthetase [bacterium]|nr:bifunctional riboflavin kinase/FAD synthetase [bacterium]